MITRTTCILFAWGQVLSILIVNARIGDNEFDNTNLLHREQNVVVDNFKPTVKYNFIVS